MNRILFFVLCLFVGAFHACKTPDTSSQETSTTFLSSAPRIAFYNVENLFDTIDDPNKPDEEFTAKGEKNWTTERYQKKLKNLNQVVEAMKYPAFLGLCEVENATVLKDLIQTDALKKYNYNFAHQDSPDYRGIDVALVYNQDNFQLLTTDVITINFPPDIVKNYTTRDVLHVTGIYNKKEKIHFLVNHWPSRRGGLKASAPKRIYVAEQVRKRVNEIFEQDKKANIVIMGDFNDEPNNESLTKALDAKPASDDPKSRELYNLFTKMDEENLGTYNYRGNWNMLDQIIVSSNLANEEKALYAKNPEIVKEQWMIFKHKKYGETPSRTYGGPNYYGGVSDHFPILIDLVRQ